jgi:hypothetical protein
MLEMRPNCERCDADLPADEPGGVICSFECTFCVACAESIFAGVCPNCGGMLTPRPTRAAALLGDSPASTERITKPHS